MKKWVVITGASSGIGQALAIFFSYTGYNVLAIGRNEASLERTKLLGYISRITTVTADLSNQAEIDNLVQQLNAEDTVEHLIHCAATTEPHSSLTSVTRSELEKIINTNVLAPIFLTQKLAPYFTSASRVLFIGSDYVGTDNKMRPNIMGSYGISKSALRVAVEYFRQEYKNTVLIGYLNPGSTDTPMYNAIKDAITSKQGVFGNLGEATSPSKIAKFIYHVLNGSSDDDFVAINWDYRVAAHHERIIQDIVIATTSAKL